MFYCCKVISVSRSATILHHSPKSCQWVRILFAFPLDNNVVSTANLRRQASLGSNSTDNRSISRSRRLRLITLTKTLIILDITKPSLVIVLLYIERKRNVASVNIHLQTWTLFCFFTDGKHTKRANLT